MKPVLRNVEKLALETIRTFEVELLTGQILNKIGEDGRDKDKLSLTPGSKCLLLKRWENSGKISYKLEKDGYAIGWSSKEWFKEECNLKINQTDFPVIYTPSLGADGYAMLEDMEDVIIISKFKG